MSQAPTRLFALDQGFPRSILAALRATGLLLARQKRWEEPWEYLKDWAVRNHESAKAMYDRLKLVGHDGKGR